MKTAVRQAVRAAPRRIVTSPLLRCRACAEQAAREIGVDVVCDEAWAEYDFGAWDGKSIDELRASSRTALDAWYDDPESNLQSGGEPWGSFQGRIVGALTALCDQAGPEARDRSILVVTHAGVMRGLLSFVTGVRPRDTWSVAIPPAALMTLRVGFDDQRRAWGQLERLLPP